MELDHFFICAEPAAPEAERLIEFGLREWSPNTHPGQGTACRRFGFANAMIELLWVSDPVEAQGESARRTLLWERWSGRRGPASPFGICARPAHADAAESLPPFPAWDYRPKYLSDPLSIRIAETGLDEPMWIYLGFQQRIFWEREFVEHPNGIRKVTGLVLAGEPEPRSAASRAMIEHGVLATRMGNGPLLEVEFDHNKRGRNVDFRPHLPLVFRF